jgi:hypothetical protein
MSVVADSLGRIRPYRENEFNPRAPILDEGPTPGLTGADGIVSNQATLWAQSGHMVISEKIYLDEDIATTWGGSTNIYYGSWSFQIPKWMNSTSLTFRRYLTLIVDTDLGASPTITMTAMTSLGNTTGVRTSYGGRWVTQFDVPLPASAPLPNDATWFTVTLKAVWSGSGSGTFSVRGVVGYVTRVTGTLNPSANNPGVIDLVDATQITTQQPLDVHSLRTLHATNEVLFASNVRPVVTLGWWPGGTDDIEDSVPLIGRVYLSDDPTDSEVNPYWEWAYFPRQGARRLRIGLGAVETGTSRELYIGFRDHPDEVVIPVTTGFTSNNPAFWQANGNVYLDIPPDDGPLFLRVGLRPPTATDGVYLMKLMVHEEILKGNNLT